MAIATIDQYIGASRQRSPYQKLAARTTVASSWFSGFDLGGNPGAGVLAGTSTTAGVVPTNATAGAANITTASGSYYISKMEFAANVACRVILFDLLFKAGAYAFNANQALSGQPSFLGRSPDANGNGLEIWVETVNAPTGNQTWNVTYTNQAGTNTQTTGAVGIGAQPTVGRCWQLPLAAGDTGVKAINNVAGGTATVGANVANILVLRPLWMGRINLANQGDTHDLLRTGMPLIYSTSCLYMLVNADSTAFPNPLDCMIEIAAA
jgi:hypothetical protein